MKVLNVLLTVFIIFILIASFLYAPKQTINFVKETGKLGIDMVKLVFDRVPSIIGAFMEVAEEVENKTNTTGEED